MPRRGPLPDPRSVTRHAGADWTDVVDEPFDYKAADRELPTHRQWHRDTMRWYAIAASLPHAALWRDDDWTFLYDLAILKQAQYTGIARSSDITEIRQRETLIGFTAEARLKNRIRYLPASSTPAAEDAPDTEGETTAGVTPIASARDRLRPRTA